ncbi:MAG: pectin acetylesterase-family hydrolase [Myxococcota bacterium]
MRDWKRELGVVMSAFALIGVGLSAGGCGDGSGVSACEANAAPALQTCVSELNDAWESCYSTTDAPCASDDANVASALSALEDTVRDSCSDDEFGALTVDGVVGRLRNSCASETTTLASRTYGGPQGAVWPAVEANDQTCLTTAHQVASTLVDDALGAINTCLLNGSCDNIDADRQALTDAAVSEVESACPLLGDLIAVTPEIYVDRANHQIDCMTATGHADTGSLTLGCGPSNADFEPVRGEYIQVEVDGDKWGTLCGDGTPFAFQVRLAPEGEPLDRILVGLQGGGVCAFEEDCTSRFESNPGLFNALDDEPTSLGIASVDPDVSPFANWTKVYVPYCNQDVFAGGGVDEVLGDITVPRYGSTNMRAAVQMVRDVIWKMMDEEGGDGFRPDEIVALFGGWSAGGYGALYNYHWFLDDLQWPRTAAFPDASGALDNGQILGVAGLGDLKIPAWGMLPNLPPYCFAGRCALGPVIYNAHAPRLKQVPEQQMLITSNQWDDTQRRDAFFRGDPSDEFWQVEWFNTMRQDYCDTKDLNGISYYYTAAPESIHVVTLNPNLWEGTIDGVVMKDWFLDAVTGEGNVESHTIEGDFVEIFEGVEPYPCEVGE